MSSLRSRARVALAPFNRALDSRLGEINRRIDAVGGGIINGCIVLPGIKILMPQPVGGFVDQFAPRVPSWVHMV